MGGKGVAEVMAKRAVITCLSPAMAKVLRTELEGDDELLNGMKGIPSCPPGSPIMFGRAGRGGGGGGAKRAPSEYNTFIGECVRAKNVKGFAEAAPAMKACSLEWKQRKHAKS